MPPDPSRRTTRHQPTAVEARQSLHAHAAETGAEIHAKYGPHIGWAELGRILEDRKCVRYPCTVEFDAEPLHPGEFAHPVPQGEHPEAGYLIYVHPFFMTQLDRVPYLVLYQLVLVNYGEFAGPEAAEAFGAHALGLSVDDYYRAVCELADALP